MAANALAAQEMGLAVVAKGDGLVATVHAGDVAPAAADALFGAEDGEYNSVAVQVAGLDKVGQLLTHER